MAHIPKGVSRRNPDSAEWMKLTESLGGYPDRLVAIMLIPFLEDALEDLIKPRLRVDLTEKQAEELFDGPLGQFAHRIRFAYALGLFGRRTRDNLMIVKDLRNAFAHARRDLSFETPEIAKAVDRLHPLPVLTPTGWVKEMLEDAQSKIPPAHTRRDRFARLVWDLQARLHGSSIEPTVVGEPVVDRNHLLD